MLHIGLGELLVIAAIGGMLLLPVVAVGALAWLALRKKKP
jgi:hypothetical protein